ncbi:hypothetical protein [Lichenibacterium ramalinae]|uniref:Uncharacterized protein n=1 Tax=Lichenibacterium ramalinae TaxID=2316527 RepID=A0A4Q2R681_9HYPH|nr:hypothetical protein [Lichenibacterium ramalinae]RYB01421.1 hypothetical protein D3272_26205 [Lichenibacterium ramalinae]
MDAREHFLSHFEPNGDDFTYRVNPDARGVLVTAEERDRMASIHGRRRHIAIVLSVLNLPLTFFVAHAVYVMPTISSWTATVAWTMLLGVTIAAFAWAFAGPRRIVRGRPYIDFGTSPFLIEQRRLKALRETSWFKLLKRWFWIGLIGFLAYIHTKDEDFERVQAAGVMFFALMSFLKEAIDKYRSVRGVPLEGAEG